MAFFSLLRVSLLGIFPRSLFLLRHIFFRHVFIRILFLRAVNSPQAREPQGTSSALSSPLKHRKSRIKCGTGFLLTFSFNGDRITPFPASGSPSAYFFGLHAALRHANLAGSKNPVSSKNTLNGRR